MKLPDGTYLAYTVTEEAWWAHDPDTPVEGDPELWIEASYGPGEGIAWGFVITQCSPDQRDKFLRLSIYSDGFDALLRLPEFFAGLGLAGVTDLDVVRTMLDQLGAVDETPRVNPTASAGKD